VSLPVGEVERLAVGCRSVQANDVRIVDGCGCSERAVGRLTCGRACHCSSDRDGLAVVVDGQRTAGCRKVAGCARVQLERGARDLTDLRSFHARRNVQAQGLTCVSADLEVLQAKRAVQQGRAVELGGRGDRVDLLDCLLSFLVQRSTVG